MLTLALSIFSLLVVVTTAFVVYYKNEQLKKETNDRLQNVVNQINDSQYYEYSFDKKQEQNIKNLDANIELVHKNLVDLQNNVKFLEKNSANKEELRKNVQTDLLTSKYLKTKSAIIANETTQNNIIIEGGRSSDGMNEGYSALNFNGYYDKGEKRINDKKSRWRIMGDQRGPDDKFGIDQYKPDNTSWNYMWLADGNVTLNNNKLRFSNKWTGWPDNAKDQAEISNDPAFGKLMIVGNKSSGEGIRKVGVWDHLDVHGNQYTTGTTKAKTIMGDDRIQTTNNNAYMRSDGYINGINVHANTGLSVGNNNAWMRNDGVSKTDSLLLGNKWKLSGVGDGMANDGWLRLTEQTGKAYYGGLAADQLFANKQICIADLCLTRNDIAKIKALK